MSNPTLGELMTNVLDLKLDIADAADTYATKEELANVNTGMTEQEVAVAFQQHYGTEVCYTLAIDETNSSPGDACVYADDAIGMTKGSSDWDAMPIFKDIKPCVFANGEVVYYLNPNNWNEKVDGTASDLTGGDGDVMIEFPKFAYRIYRNGSILYVSITNNTWLTAIDGRFNLDAFSRIDVGDLEHFYQGAYKGYLDTNTGKLRSIAGVLPTQEKEITVFRTAAQLNGNHYQQNVYSHIKALQCLYLIKYGNRDGQAALGIGVGQGDRYICGYNIDRTSQINDSNSTAALGMYFGNTIESNEHMRFAGIEDFWGNLREWVDGMSTDEFGKIIIHNDDFNENNIKLKKYLFYGGPQPITVNKWVKTVYGNSIAGFVPIAPCFSREQYWTGMYKLSNSGNLAFGGDFETDMGPFCYDTAPLDMRGSRLTFH